MVNDIDQQAGINNANITVREAQEEETCLCKEVQQGTEDEEEKIQQKTELTATLATVKQLKAQKAEREARQGILTLSVIGGPQSQNGLTSRQGEKFFVSIELFERYPAIDKIHFKAIKENTFKPINVVKLTTKMALDRNKVKILAMGSEVAVDTREEDALLGELKRLSYLI